ncbi:MAG TPA: hypothetical protein VGK73_03810 [Polyangiaceae bacterium]
MPERPCAGGPGAGGADAGSDSGGTNPGGAGAGGNAGQDLQGGTGGVLSSCPPAMATGAPCEGSFVCNYPGMCTSCGCCSGATACTDGLITYLGYNDGCLQCPFGGAGGQAGGGGQAGQNGGAGSGANVPDLSTCDYPAPCELVSETFGELTLPPSDEALRCVVQHLYERTPGIYLNESTLASGIGPGTQTTRYVYLVKEDGTVNRITQAATPTNPQVCALQPPSAYEACLASTAEGTAATTECRNVTWVTDCTTAEVSCDQL